MNKNKIIYSINIEDVQRVANDILDRDLTKKEINELEEAIANNISWYDAIEQAINEKILQENFVEHC